MRISKKQENTYIKTKKFRTEHFGKSIVTQILTLFLDKFSALKIRGKGCQQKNTFSTSQPDSNINRNILSAFCDN